MFINAYQQIRERMDLKVQTAAFSILSLLYFVLYTVVSIILGNIVNDVATVIGFWMLNLVSTYVYMRFFFRIIAATRKEETVIYFRDCLWMLVLESLLFGFTILVYYAFVWFIDLYTLIGIIAYVYVFFCTTFQLFCFYEVYRGNRTLGAIVSGALRHMLAAWKGVLAACTLLVFSYCVLYICSMGVDITLQVIQPHVVILNIGVTMNRWMEVGTVVLTMLMSGLFDSTILLFLLYQVIAALLFSYFYIIWMGWITQLCEASWNSEN